MLWYKNLGRFYNENLNKYLKLHNMKPTNSFDCKIEKLDRKPNNLEIPKTSLPLETIHSDLIWPIQKSFTDKKYILTIKKVGFFFWKINLKLQTIINFFNHLNNQFSEKIKNFILIMDLNIIIKKLLIISKKMEFLNSTPLLILKIMGSLKDSIN